MADEEAPVRPIKALRTVPLAALAVVIAAGPAAAAAPAAASPGGISASGAEQLIRGVEKRYAAIRTLTANFTQTFRSAELGQSLVERGRIFVRKPGHMRWDYRDPEKKIFIVEPDGKTLSYIPADLRAVRSRLPPDAAHLKLLMGSSDLLADYAASEVTLKTPAFPGSRAIKLVPRQTADAVAMIYLEIDPRMLSIERVLVVDPEGNESDLVLDRVQENGVVKPDAFDVRIPPGIVVQDAAVAAER